ncbi:LysM peptidoglycan-binding domain-containing protein [Gordonia sp. HY002]|uniref:LysM peptidoglycan-binding domain-containing protein n=1 Tax=Gordonia zhenghanii TaxID=2911516 RepID=UPI001EF080BF|nr:LysM peptidoglycan-binding domain-containing protein [Gordonia zhenghanii]MCF8569644.1 LysM peptidoglycan-binding domain-containing protein [Gordonia zhenghanii]MCF8602835.1 LysM peptidoglycan-binding domain-containing protein [Gordonia zhenghanii]
MTPERGSRRRSAVDGGREADLDVMRGAVSGRSNIDAVIGRRRLVGALAVGALLAGVVWLFTIVGSDYEDAATPGTPGVTQVVHARSGESLSDIARRIATDLPVAGVVEQLRELNHLQSSGLRVGQSLIAPAY